MKIINKISGFFLFLLITTFVSCNNTVKDEVYEPFEYKQLIGHGGGGLS